MAALARSEFELAIAHLSAIGQTAADARTQIRAQVGLIQAYRGSGNIQQAIACCETLLGETLIRSPNAQAHQWALQMLETLRVAAIRPSASRSASLPASDPSGFTPLPPTGAADSTGFVPLSPTPTSSAPSSPRERVDGDSAGFTPLGGQPPTTGRESVTGAQLPNLTPAAKNADESSLGRDAGASDRTDDWNPFDAAVESSMVDSSIESDASAQRPVTDAQRPVTDTYRAAETEIPGLPRQNWRQAGRAQKWSGLGKLDRSTLWGVQALTAIALLVLGWGLWKALIVVIVAPILGLIPSLALYDLRQLLLLSNPIVWIGLGLVAIAALSPWLLDRILQSVYGAKSMHLDLLSRYSPESTRVLRRFGQGRSLPRLWIVYTNAPLALTYGLTPQDARLVVSQGLLDQLSDDEIAVIVAGELGHITTWDFAMTSFVTLLAQIPYGVYSRVSAWGDRQHDRVLQSVAVGVSSLGYGFYRLLRAAGLWLSRLRLSYSDRIACEMTGNPNGLTRALLKMALGIAQDVRRQGRIMPLLESFDLLIPVGCPTALTLGSVGQSNAFEPLLVWDYSHPLRRWLWFNNTHPPLGDRLQQIARYARHWRLESELNLPLAPGSESGGRPWPLLALGWGIGGGIVLSGLLMLLGAIAEPLNWATAQWVVLNAPGLELLVVIGASIGALMAIERRCWLQLAPLIGAAWGAATVGLLWVVGVIARYANWLELDWMWGDRSLLVGCLLIGLGIGTFTRINPLFPDIRREDVQVNPRLGDLLSDATISPLNSVPVRFTGKLLGDRGFSNQLSQSLILQCDSGLIALHHQSPLGAVGDLFPQALRPRNCVGQSVTITGWFRRGATPWVDIDTLQAPRGIVLKSGHPLWLTLLSFVAVFLGLYTILRGS
ncbi:MAG TPA: M48 family metalloprotease [Chroococcidiopsis sp.]